MRNKTLQQLIEDAKKDSPLVKLTGQQAALKVSNNLKKGVPIGVKTKGAFIQGHIPWNKGRTDDNKWGKTRKERAAEMSEEERRAYFGVNPQHSLQTRELQSESARARWAKTHRRVQTDQGIFESIYKAGEALGCHPDTIRYRIKKGRYSYLD